MSDGSCNEPDQSPSEASSDADGSITLAVLFGIGVVLVVVGDPIAYLLVRNDVRWSYGFRDLTLSVSFAALFVVVMLGPFRAALNEVGHRGTRAVAAFFLGVICLASLLNWSATLSGPEALRETVLLSQSTVAAPFDAEAARLVWWHLLDAIPVLNLTEIFDVEKPPTPVDPPFLFRMTLALTRLSGVIVIAAFFKTVWDAFEREAYTDAPTASPGWYSKEQGAPTLHWWDGQRWTDREHVAPGSEPDATEDPDAPR
jgi:hypothetical protein